VFSRTALSAVPAAAPVGPPPAVAVGAQTGLPPAVRPTRLRLDTLTSLRGLAALAVFGFHAAVTLVDPSAALARVVSVPSKQSIGFFFALSGFVLTWALRPGDRLLPFWRRRFARIYPAYLVVLLASALASLALNGVLPIGPFLASLFLVQAFVPDTNWYYAFNPVGWTLSCEALFYILLPLFIRPLARLPLRGRRTVQAVLLLSVLGISLVARHLDSVWLSGVFPLTRLPEFVLGCTLAMDVAAGHVVGRRVGLAAAVTLSAAAAVASMLPFPAVRYLPFMTVPLLLLLCAGAKADLEGRRTVVTWRPFVWFGEISFCFYLVQLKILVGLATVVAVSGPAGDRLKPVWVLLALALSTLVAWLLHRFVERPGEQWLRGRSRRRAPVALQH